MPVPLPRLLILQGMTSFQRQFKIEQNWSLNEGNHSRWRTVLPYNFKSKTSSFVSLFKLLSKAEENWSLKLESLFGMKKAGSIELKNWRGINFFRVKLFGYHLNFPPNLNTWTPNTWIYDNAWETLHYGFYYNAIYNLWQYMKNTAL